MGTPIAPVRADTARRSQTRGCPLEAEAVPRPLVSAGLSENIGEYNRLPLPTLS